MTQANQSSAVEYDFHGRLTARFPSQVIVDITEVCNLACIHCPHPEFKKSSNYSARYLDPALNTKMVDEVKASGGDCTQYIRYTSEGEPLVHPKGYEMIEYAARNSGVFVTLTTNGTIMNEKRTRRLLESGVHMIDISIDAMSAEVYSQIRVGGDLAVTNANVINLLKWIRQSDSPTKVVVSFVEQAQNLHQAAAFEKFWKEQGAHFVIIRRLHSAAGAAVDIANLLRKKTESMTRYPCLYPWERITLNPRGELSFCPQDWVHGSSIVDYRNSTIEETWQSDFYRKLRQAHLSNDFSCHAFCGKCPDWSATRWPGQGRSYADLVQEMKSE